MDNKLIKDRLSVIVAVVLGSGTGWSLSGFIEVAEIKQWLIGIAIAFSLIISFIISINYKSSRTKLHKQKFRRYASVSAVIFILMMTAFFLSYNGFVVRLPVNVQMLDNSYKTVDSTFIKGLYFTGEAKNEINRLKQNQPSANIDMRQVFRSANNNIDEIWDNTSRTLAKLIVLFSYIFFIAAFTAVITIATEMYQDKNKKKAAEA
jgi:phosphatidylglycerophosphate synthase